MTGLTQTDGVIKLPPRLDLTVAGQLRETVLGETRDIVLDAGAVTLLTTSCAQVLMAARDHQQANDRTLRLRAPSDGFRACANTLGLTLDRLQTGGPGA